MAKYCMLHGLLERVPTQQELNKWLTSGQLETLLKGTSDPLETHLTILDILEKYLKGSAKVAQYDRKRKNQKKAENCEKEQKIPTENPTETRAEFPIKNPMEKNRTDKNRENRESNTSPNGYVLPRAPARATPAPTLDEVLTYAKSQTEMAGVGGFPCAPHTAEQFWAHYQSQGWRKSNDCETPVRDWRAALRLWCLTTGPGKSAAPPPVNNDDLPV